MNYLDTLERDSDAELAQLDVDETARALGRIAYECGEADTIDEAERQQLSRALQALQRVEAAHPSATSVAPAIIRAVILGKLGHFEAAITAARQAYAATPAWDSAICVANACRRAGDLQGAIGMWMVAAELDPKDVTAFLEVGDTYLFLKEWDAAIRAYEQALDREPNNAWAVPSLHYCRYRATGDRRWLQRVQRRAKKIRDACGVESFIAQLTGTYSADVGIERAQQLLEIDAASR